jgi:hypothetical protein
MLARDETTTLRKPGTCQPRQPVKRACQNSITSSHGSQVCPVALVTLTRHPRQLGGFYTIGPNERAVLCTFGRAQWLPDETTLSDPIADHGWLTALHEPRQLLGAELACAWQRLLRDRDVAMITLPPCGVGQEGECRAADASLGQAASQLLAHGGIVYVPRQDSVAVTVRTVGGRHGPRRALPTLAAPLLRKSLATATSYFPYPAATMFA